MPWNPAQTRLFMAAAHNPAIAAEHGIKPKKAAAMAAESSHEDRSDAMTHQTVLADMLRKRLRPGESKQDATEAALAENN